MFQILCSIPILIKKCNRISNHSKTLWIFCWLYYYWCKTIFYTTLSLLLDVFKKGVILVYIVDEKTTWKNTCSIFILINKVKRFSIRNFTGGDIFSRGREPEEEWFWWFEPFSKLKTVFINTEHQLKSKLTRTKCPKSTKFKQKWNRSNDYT